MAEEGTRKAKPRTRLRWGLRLGLLGGLLAAALTVAGLTRQLEVLSRDLRFRVRGTVEAPAEVVLVTIDQRSLDVLGRYPWERGVLAEVVERLTAAEPGCLALDLALLESSTPEADQRLARALEAAPTVLPVYLAALPLSLSERPTPSRDGGPLYWYTPAPPFRRAATALGHVALDPDVDGIYRNLYLEQSYGGRAYPAFAAAATAVYRGELPQPGDVPVDDAVGQRERLLINYRGPAGTFERYGVTDVLAADDAELRRRLGGRLVFLGASAAGLHDSVISPFTAGTPLPAVEVHANAAATLMANDEPVVWPRWVELLLLVALGGFSGVLFIRGRPMVSLLLLLGGLAAWTGLGLAAFLLFNALLPLVSPLLALALCFLLVSLGRLISVNRALDEQLLELGRNLRGGRLAPGEPRKLTKEAETSLTYTLGLLGMRVTSSAGEVLYRHGDCGGTCDGEPEPPRRIYRDFGDGVELCLCYSGTPSVNEAALLAACSNQVKALFNRGGESVPGPFAGLSREHTQAKLDILVQLGDALAASRSTLQRVLGATAKTVLLTNAYGVIQLANLPARGIFTAADVLEADGEDLVGRSVYSLFPGQNLRQIIVDAVDGPTSNTVKLHGNTYLLEVSPLADEGGLRGFVITLTDITELARIDRMKTEVMHIMSHDLKGPLGTIHGFGELLTDEEITDEERRQYGGYVASESGKLIGLIEAFLDVSRIESGRIKGEFLPVELSEIAAEALELTRDLAGRRGVELVLRGTPHGPVVSLDAGLVSRALVNLIDNAIKFSPDGGLVTVEVQRTPRGGEILVTDQGPGIPPGDQKRIFDKFYRAANAAEVPGTGMGLAFVAQVARLHSAEIVVHSTPGGGSTFTLRFPDSDDGGGDA